MRFFIDTANVDDIRKANDIMREIQQDRLIRGLNKEKTF